MTPWSRRNGWKLVLLFVLLVCSAITLYSASMVPRYDRWQYPVWYLSEYLLTTGQLPTCAQASAEVRPAWTGKICLRIQTPGHPISVATYTSLLGLDFTGSFKRLFVFTPLLKLAAGYLLATQFVRSRTARVLTTGLVYLSPNYSTLFFTTAKGLSFSLLLFSVYFLIRALRDDFRWVLPYLLSFVLLLNYYVPRSILVLVFVAGVAHFMLSERKIMRGLILAYNTVLALYLFQAELVGDYYRDITSAVEPGLLLSITTGTEPVPFSQSSSGVGWVMLLPLGALGAAGGLLALRERKAAFLSDERMLWLYALVVGYLPVGILFPFFRTRLFFEAAVPGLLVAGEQYDRGTAGRYLKLGGVVVTLFLVLGYALSLSGAVAYGAEYDALSETMADANVPDDAVVFTDMKTGAYLVGQRQHLNTTMLTNGTDRETIGAVWYDSNATAACRVMADAGSDYFVLREDVQRYGVPVMNYDRLPVPEPAVTKYRDSSRYDRVVDAWAFDVYRLNGC